MSIDDNPIFKWLRGDYSKAPTPSLPDPVSDAPQQPGERAADAVLREQLADAEQDMPV